MVGWDPLTLGLREVKTGRRPGARGARQQRRLDELTTLINTGRHPTADRGGPLALDVCPLPIATRQAQIERVLAAAKHNTYSCEELEEGVLVEAFDLSDPGELVDRDLTAASERALAQRRWNERDVLRQSVETRRLRDRQETGNQLPLALLPFAAADTTGLLMGPLDYSLTVHAPTLQRRLARAG